MLDDLKGVARDLVAQVGEKAGIGGLRDALDQLEQAGRKQRVDAVVRSAVPLTDAERQALEARLHSRYGQDLPIAYEVDAALLGGLVLRVGDRYIDGSVANRLGQLRRALTGGSAG